MIKRVWGGEIIPNIITALRIVLSVVMLFLKPFSPAFLSVYMLCGVSDVLDGYIARKTNTVSKFGSRFDSIADIVFVTVLFIVLFSVVKIPVGIIIWVIVIAIIRITSLSIVFHKHHTFAILHTYANKLTGAMLFCSPILYQFVDATVLECLVCVVASASAVEELLIHIKSEELKVDRNLINH